MILIGFSTRRGSFLSWLIRKATGSRVSHTWLLDTSTFYGVPMVIETALEGFRGEAYESFQRSNDVLAVFEVGAPLDAQMPTVAKWLGKRYDTEGLLGSAWVQLGRRLHRVWQNPWQNQDALFCSEAVAKVLVAAEHPGFEDAVPEQMTPQDIYEKLLIHGRRMQ